MKKRKAVERFGERFGFLEIMPIEPEYRESPSGYKFAYMTVRCDCGNIIKTYLGRLTTHRVVSCGCYLGKMAGARQTVDRNTTHGYAKTRTYRAWKSMKARCLYPSATGYKYYGGKGIKVCDRWRRFQFFLDDMGVAPPEMTLERKDCAGDYEPNNCLWAPWSVQHINKGNTVRVSINGESMSFSGACKTLGVTRKKVYKIMQTLRRNHQEAFDYLRTKP